MRRRVLREGPLCDALLAAAGDDLRQWLPGAGRVVKHDERAIAVVVRLEDRECFAKLSFSTTRWQALRHRLGSDHALRGFDAAQRLHAAGLPVPEPLCCLSVDEGTLMLGAAVPGTNLASLWRGDPGHALDWYSIMQRSAQTLAELHAAGYVHGKCKWSKLVLAGDHCTLVDLDTVRRARPARRLQARDIARFTLNAEELQLPLEYYEAFMETYCGAMGRDWHEVIRATIPQLKKYRRRLGRRFSSRGHHLLGEG